MLSGKDVGPRPELITWKTLRWSSSVISISTSPDKPTGKVCVLPKIPEKFKSNTHLTTAQGLSVLISTFSLLLSP